MKALEPQGLSPADLSQDFHVCALHPYREEREGLALVIIAGMHNRRGISPAICRPTICKEEYPRPVIRDPTLLIDLLTDIEHLEPLLDGGSHRGISTRLEVWRHP